MTKTYIVYADGACSGNPGPGGWAFEIQTPDGRFISGANGSSDTTNNIMELTAAAAALETLGTELGIAFSVAKSDVLAVGEIIMRLDSQYVLDGLFKWLPGWKAKGWKTSGKKPVKNREIWERLDTAYNALREQGYIVTPEWVKGHDGEPGNERVDTAAQEQRDYYMAMPKSDILMEAAAAEGISVTDVPASRATASIIGMPEFDGEDLETPTGAPVGYNNAGFDQMTPLKNPTAMIDPLSLTSKIGQQGKTMMAPAVVHPGQVDLMRTILDLYASGDYSVKKVIEQIRDNAIALGIK